MSKQIEAMKLALEALKNCRENLFLKDYVEHIDLTITALREALAEQPAQQKPVAWMCHPFGDAECEFSERQECENCVPLYTTPQAQPAPVQYQRREIGEGDWEDCTKEQYEKAMALPEWDTRVITTPQAQPRGEATLAPEPDQQAAAVMPCGAVVSNVYEAYEAGKKAQPAQRKPLTDDKYEAIVEDIADWNRYVEVDTAHQSLEKHVREVLTAHGITKGNT